jgi:hypothetical protein
MALTDVAKVSWYDFRALVIVVRWYSTGEGWDKKKDASQTGRDILNMYSNSSSRKNLRKG